MYHCWYIWSDFLIKINILPCLLKRHIFHPTAINTFSANSMSSHLRIICYFVSQNFKLKILCYGWYCYWRFLGSILINYFLTNKVTCQWCIWFFTKYFLSYRFYLTFRLFLLYDLISNFHLLIQFLSHSLLL